MKSDKLLCCMFITRVQRFQSFQCMVSHYRGIPPLDNANTLYIEVEEVSGTPANSMFFFFNNLSGVLPITFSSPLNKRSVPDILGYGKETYEVFILN